MKSVRDWFLLILAIVAISAAIKYCCNDGDCTYNFPSYSEGHPPPTGTDPSQIFSLSQDYPQTLPTDITPWTAIDFIGNPQGYAQSVLQYSLEGNIAVDFKGQNNSVRKWYHAPWLHSGENGREFRHGLTRERNSRVGELHPNQTSQVFTWAVGMLNPLGGYALGQVWPKCGGEPKPDMATSPEGTVACKLIFTTATTAEVPYIQGAFEWTANIGAIGSPRTDRSVRLLQIDIAVKDHRSPIGWVFGTFVYDGANPAPSPWDRFALVGLSWGNDPTVTSMMNTAGAYLNPSLTESYINPSIIGDPNAPGTSAKMFHLGIGGRLNGPVDNPSSSCTSCHGKAANLKEHVPSNASFSRWNPRPFDANTVANYTALDFADYFGTNTPPGTGDVNYNQFIAGGADHAGDYIKTDYSLQIAIGIRRYYEHLHDLAEQEAMR